MMGTIVLTMLLGWFGVVAVLALLSPSGEEGLAEESVRVTGAPHVAPDEPQSGIGA